MDDNRSLRECLSDLPDAVVLGLVLIVGAYAVGELIVGMI